MSRYLFEEARYCYAYGQFLATTILGLAFIERTLASLLYGSGRNDLERASISRLLREALDSGLITQSKFDSVNQARRIRNAITHFRKPGDSEGIEYRSLSESESPYIVIEKDAKGVMETVLHLLGTSLLSV